MALVDFSQSSSTNWPQNSWKEMTSDVLYRKPCTIQENCISNADTGYTEFSLPKVNLHHENITQLIDQSQKTGAVVVCCTEWIRLKTKECVNYCKVKMKYFIHEISSHHDKNCSKVLKDRLDLLIGAEEGFQSHVKEIKEKCIKLNCLSLQEAVVNAKILLKDFQHECQMLTSQFLMYAHKKKILDCVNQNQVTVVIANPEYDKGIQLPFYVLKEYGNKGIILSCHPYQVSATCMANQLNLLLKETDGTVVGYYPGMSQEKDLKIIFLTPYNLLSEPNLLLHASCIIIDEAQDRCFNTDILFIKIRELLKQKSDLKLIVAPTCGNTSAFSTYFSNVTNVNVISLPDITFPRKIVWKEMTVNLVRNYVNEVAETVAAIHMLKEVGDILVFLSSDDDINVAYAVLQKVLVHQNSYTPLVYCVYEDTFDSNIFELFNINTSQRRIILSTKCTESSLHFPAVKYTVDSGIAVKKHYKHNDKITHSSCFISKENANKRAACSGSVKNSICYRIYSKKNFDDFEECTLPEIYNFEKDCLILRLLKLHQENLKDVELLESHGKLHLQMLVSRLSDLGIIRDLKCTPLGKQVICLPYKLEYSKLLILGLERGCEFHAAVLVAVLSLNTSLFNFKKGKKENEKCLESKKLAFSDPKGDTFTALNIYSHWLSLMASTVKENWCDKNGINFKAINALHSSVNDICDVVETSLRKDIKFCELITNNFTTDSELIQNIVFESLISNLCIFTGHFRCGYRSVFSDAILFLHPSSSLFYKEGNPPMFVVYGHVQKSSRNFMVNVTVVTEKMVQDAIEERKLHIDIEAIKSVNLVPLVIDSLGVKLIKQHLLGVRGQKLHTVENAIKTATKSDLVVIDPDVDKGLVVLYTLPQHIQRAEIMLRGYLESALDTVKNKEEIVPLTMSNGQTPINVLLGRGARIKEYPAKQNLSENSENKEKSDSESKNSESTLDDFTQYSINLSWCRRRCKGCGYISFSKTHFSIARSKLALTQIYVKGVHADVQVDKTRSNQLYITGLGPFTNNEDVRKAIQKLLPESVTIENCIILYVDPYETQEGDIEKLKNFLLNFCSQYISPDRVKVVVPKPKSTATTMKAHLNFVNFQDSLTIKNELKDIKISGCDVETVSVFRSVLFFPTAAFELILNSINKTLEKMKAHIKMLDNLQELEPFRFEHSSIDNQTTRLKLLTNDNMVMSALKLSLNKLLEGDTLNNKNVSNLHKLFTHGGKMWVSHLQKETFSYIILDHRTEIVRIFGSPQACRRVKLRIVDYLKNSDSEIVKTVDLSHKANTRSLLKTIIENYGVNLHKLILKCGLRSAEMNVIYCKLILQGSPESIEKADKELESLEKSLNSQKEVSFEKNEELCPVCFCPPPSGQSFRLECCGHLYCLTCFHLLIMDTNIPVVCCKTDCKEEVALQDIIAVVEENKEHINKILAASIKAFVIQNQPHIAYCCSPDCPMVYDKRQMAASTTWTCPICHNEVCVLCGVLVHYGYTCEEYKKMSEDPESVKDWMRKEPALRKQCPSCHMAIEKNDGCNHMTCMKCNTHFCWKCLKSYPTGSEVYSHQLYCKGDVFVQ